MSQDNTDKLTKEFLKLKVQPVKEGKDGKMNVDSKNISSQPLRHYNSLAVEGTGTKVKKSEKEEPENFDDIEAVEVVEEKKKPEIPKTESKIEKEKTPTFTAEKVIGNGSFGVVYLAKANDTGETVAIKEVLQDKRFKNRELQMMKLLNHVNVVQMKYNFYSNGNKKDELYLNLVLEYVPETVYKFTSQYRKKEQSSNIPLIYVKLFTYQLCRALNYIHSLSICHRDIKPQNLLINPETGVLKICDFGSAKQLVKGEPNVSYICSRYYRAPELIFGATQYTTAIDIWSVGCCFGEMLLGVPLFAGGTSIDQLVEIIRILGTPTIEQIEAMNKEYLEFKFPTVKAQPWSDVFSSRKESLPQEAYDLISRFLQYDPEKRITPIEAMCHPFFDELLDPETKLPSGRKLPDLFNFTELELKTFKGKETLVGKLLAVKK